MVRKEKKKSSPTRSLLTKPPQGGPEVVRPHEAPMRHGADKVRELFVTAPQRVPLYRWHRGY